MRKITPFQHAETYGGGVCDSEFFRTRDAKRANEFFRTPLSGVRFRIAWAPSLGTGKCG